MSAIERLRTFEMKDLSCLDDLYDALNLLAREVRRIISSYRPGAAQLHELAGDLAQMRRLISVLPAEKAQRPQTEKELIERYLELEGWIKELRNDSSL